MEKEDPGKKIDIQALCDAPLRATQISRSPKDLKWAWKGLNMELSLPLCVYCNIVVENMLRREKHLNFVIWADLGKNHQIYLQEWKLFFDIYLTIFKHFEWKNVSK